MNIFKKLFGHKEEQGQTLTGRDYNPPPGAEAGSFDTHDEQTKPTTGSESESASPPGSPERP